MKKKRFAALLIAAPLTLFAACSSTPSLELNQNWFSNTGEKNIPADFEETLVYAVSFEKSDSALKGKYYMDYPEGGTYKTTFKSAAGSNGQMKYVYETELSVKVQYTLNGASTELMESTVTTHVEFLEAQNNLKPLLSRREAHGPVPIAEPYNPPASLEKAYNQYDYKVEIAYDHDASKADFAITYFSPSPEGSEEDQSYSEHKQIKLKSFCFDNEQLIPVLRAAELSSSMPLYAIDFTTKTLEKISVKNKPTNLDSWKQSVKFKGDETAVERDFKVTTVGIAYGKKNSGGTHTYTLARRSDSADSNTYRNVVLKYSYPVIYSHGTTVYNLVAANFYN